jgi:serine/threonine protein phosphatase PrpC
MIQESAPIFAHTSFGPHDRISENVAALRRQQASIRSVHRRPFDRASLQNLDYRYHHDVAVPMAALRSYLYDLGVVDGRRISILPGALKFGRNTENKKFIKIDTPLSLLESRHRSDPTALTRTVDPAPAPTLLGCCSHWIRNLYTLYRERERIISTAKQIRSKLGIRVVPKRDTGEVHAHHFLRSPQRLEFREGKMGNLLGAPVTEKATHTGVTSSGLAYGVSSMQGWRVHMEDAHITESVLYAFDTQVEGGGTVIDLPFHSLFAVFDGHGGLFAAAYAGRNLCRVLSQEQSFVEYAKFLQQRSTREPRNDDERNTYLQEGLALLQQALTEAFMTLDKEIYCALHNQPVPDANKPYHQWRREIQGEDMNGSAPIAPLVNNISDEANSGTTACVVLLTPDWIVCANAGDSRSVLLRRTADGAEATIALSFDHKPDDLAEEQRIRAAGGYVAGGRVEGDLAVSRGFGDYRFKIPVVVLGGGGQAGHQKVSPIPDILVQPRDAQQDAFIIIACDGIWDVQSNVEAVQTVATLFQEGETNLGLICEEVCENAVVCLAVCIDILLAVWRPHRLFH